MRGGREGERATTPDCRPQASGWLAPHSQPVLLQAHFCNTAVFRHNGYIGNSVSWTLLCACLAEFCPQKHSMNRGRCVHGQSQGKYKAQTQHPQVSQPPRHPCGRRCPHPRPACNSPSFTSLPPPHCRHSQLQTPGPLQGQGTQSLNYFISSPLTALALLVPIFSFECVSDEVFQGCAYNSTFPLSPAGHTVVSFSHSDVTLNWLYVISFQLA